MKTRIHSQIKIVISILPFFLACTLDPVVIDPENAGEYYVLCTLSAGSSRQKVRVGRSRPEHLPVDITDAQVGIYTDAQDVPFVHFKDGFYVENGEKLQVINGETYYLDVHMKNGDRISAETTIPGDFQILHPSSGDTVEHFVSMSLDTLLLDRIFWNDCSEAEHYRIMFDIRDPELNFQPVNTFKTNIFMPEIIAYDWGKPLSGEKIIETTLYVFARGSTHCFFLYISPFYKG